MHRLSFDKIRNVLCLGAHADDIEIGCGGTLLKLRQQNPNLTVSWIVLAADETRCAEAKHSSHQFLASENHSRVQIKQFPDRYFPAAWSEIKDFFCQLASELSGNQTPDLILTHRLDDRHQDHRVVSELTWNAFRDHLILEYEIPKYEGDLGQPNVYVSLEPNWVDKKIANLMECFPSQSDHHWFDEETFRSLMRIRGLESGTDTRHAEAFHSRKLVFD